MGFTRNPKTMFSLVVPLVNIDDSMVPSWSAVVRGIILVLFLVPLLLLVVPCRARDHFDVPMVPSLVLLLLCSIRVNIDDSVVLFLVPMVPSLALQSSFLANMLLRRAVGERPSLFSPGFHLT